MASQSTFFRMRRRAATTALGIALTLGAWGVAQAGASHQPKPRGLHTQAQKARPAGDYTRHTDVQRTQNGHTRTDMWTGENGKSATRQAEVVNDRATQTRTRDVEWTGPEGQQATRSDVTQRTDNGYTRNTTAVGPKGGTTTRDVVATHDQASGTWNRDVTVDHSPPPAPSNGG